MFTPCHLPKRSLGWGFSWVCMCWWFFSPNTRYNSSFEKTHSHRVPHIEAEFKGDVIFCLVFVYVPPCSPPSPLRFISSGNISKFSCTEAFARGCALTIRTEVSGDNAVKTQARASLKQTTKGLKQIEKKQKQVHQIAQTQNKV